MDNNIVVTINERCNINYAKENPFSNSNLSGTLNCKEAVWIDQEMWLKYLLTGVTLLVHIN